MKRAYAEVGSHLADILGRLGLNRDSQLQAVSEGRVFFGRTRAIQLETVLEYACDVVLYAPRIEVLLPDPFVLFADPDVLVVHKPAHVPTIADQAGIVGSLQERAARLLDVPVASLHPTSRLDESVSGVVTFARSQRGQKWLKDARDAGTYHRRYIAFATGQVLPGSWDFAIDRDLQDPKKRRAVVPLASGKSPKSSTARPAKTLVSVLSAQHLQPSSNKIASSKVQTSATLLALVPITGRTHQLRVHASVSGHPLWGDGMYGGPTRVTSADGKVTGLDRVALHCLEVSVLGATWIAPPPPFFELLSTLLTLDPVWAPSLKLTP